jgi:hypothetical protein
MKKINIFIFFLALLWVTGLNAQQVTFKMPDMSADPGVNIHVDLQVENFQDVTGMQFSINWDSSVLEFIGVDNFGLPDLTYDGNFGAIETAEGKLRFVWYKQDLTGVDLEDMSTIFSLWFKTIGVPSSTSKVMITNDPIEIEVVGTSGMLPYDVQNSGTITVGGPNSSKETLTNDFVLFQNNPNPFLEMTYISFNLFQNSPAELIIYDPSGKVILKQNMNFAAGMHRIPVSRDIFHSRGAYFYTLKTERATATRQLIVQ